MSSVVAFISLVLALLDDRTLVVRTYVYIYMCVCVCGVSSGNGSHLLSLCCCPPFFVSASSCSLHLSNVQEAAEMLQQLTNDTVRSSSAGRMPLLHRRAAVSIKQHSPTHAHTH